MEVLQSKEIEQTLVGYISLHEVVNKILEQTAIGLQYRREDVLCGAEKVKRHFKELDNEMDLPDDVAIIGTLFLELANLAGIPATDPIYLLYVGGFGHVYHKGELEENEYYRNICLDNIKCGNFEIKQVKDKEYEIFSSGVPVFANGIIFPSIGVCDYEYEYASLQENGEPWMSISPSEMETMKEHIEKAHGKVLTLGCGMGYYAYMAARKLNVESVTIIEKSPEVIELFKKHILPQFECKDKIRIIQADAFEYVEQIEDGVYDYCFADIWQGGNDIILYLQMKILCRKFRLMEISYWIEETFTLHLSYIAAYLMVKKIYVRRDGMSARWNKEDNADFDKICAILKEAYRHVEIKTVNDVTKYLDPEMIGQMIASPPKRKSPKKKKRKK